jgi:protein ImuA
VEHKISPPGIRPGQLPFSPKVLPRSSPRIVGHETFDRGRDGDTPHAVPAPLSSETPASLGCLASKTEILADLASRIRIIEQRGAAAAPDRAPPPLASGSEPEKWCLGVPEIDGRLGPGGLETDALHEIKPALCEEGGGDWTGAVTAAIAFALALSQRRRIALETAHAARGTPPPGPMLWCFPSDLAQEIGRPYPAGLASFGLDPDALVLVEPDKTADVLWTLEESLKSGSLHLVLGVVRDVGLTPARRLALAAAARATPCLLVTDPRTPETAATSTRWRVTRTVSTRHPMADLLDEALPGAPRYRVSLERCRAGSLAGPISPLILEWSDATYRFSLASTSSHRAYPEVRPRRHRG